MNRVQFCCCCLSSATLAVLAAPTVNAAEGIEYSWLQLNAVGRDIDAYDDDEGVIEDFDDGGGFGIEGSWAFTDNFFVFGAYSETDSDVTFVNPDIFPLPADTDIKRLDLGIGGIMEMNDRVDLVGRLGYVDIDYGSFNLGASSDPDAGDLFDDDSDGYLVDVLVRSQLLTNLEGSIGVRYIDVSFSDTDFGQDFDNTSLLGSLLFELSPAWDIDFSIDAGDDVASYLLGVRWSPE